MPDAVVVENLSKRYRLGHREEFKSLRETLLRLPRRLLRSASASPETIWVLKDVSIRIRQGEAVGIIGRNGAGKSTLLKILSRITYPSSGKVHVHGRVASLLEVGTGFHDELTGWENVFLNGSILGMKKREIEARIDRIFEFAEVARFAGTPIKHYSSGMRLRLGFAVAAHLDPDILIIDEVLAVGDLAFQRKCFKVMEELLRGGRTVLVVSHNLSALENLCSRVIWIDNGSVRADGPAAEVLEAYLAAYVATSTRESGLRVDDRDGKGGIRYTRVEFLSPKGAPHPVVRSGDGLVIRLHYRATETIRYPAFGVRFFTPSGAQVAELNTRHSGPPLPAIVPGESHIDLQFETLPLLPGRYYLWISIKSMHDIHCVYDGLPYAVHLDVHHSEIAQDRGGVVMLPGAWKPGPGIDSEL